MKKSVLKTLGSLLLLLVLIQMTSPVLAQSSVVKGRITSSDEGEGLPGVSILEKGTTNGTVTDLDGNYSLSVDAGSTIVVSYIGYTTQEVAVGSRSEISLVLEPDVETLEEIVVIGYGTQKKASLSSAVTSVNIDDIQKLPGANVANLLQGQMPGVTANIGSGAPGSAPAIRIRGLSTIGDNDPLFVIDGIPGNISSINPSDIESINVLKDAAAATIYGSRASNGVVIVTTKRGKTGAPVVTLSSYIGVNSNPKKLDVLNREQNNQVSNAAHAADGSTPLDYTSLPITNDTDWQDASTRTGLEQKYDLGISGGNEFANYHFSVGYFGKEGTFVGSDYDRYNMRMNADFKVSERIKIGQTFSYSRDIRNRFGEDERSDNEGWTNFSPILDVLSSLPHNAVYNPTTENGYAIAEIADGAENIVGRTEVVTDRWTRDRFQGSIFLEARIIEGLKFRTQGGLNVYSNDRISHIPTYEFGPRIVNDRPILEEERRKTTEWIWNNVLDFSKTFGDHNVSALAGVVAEENKYTTVGARNNNVASNQLKALGAGIGESSVYGRNETNTLFSTFLQANYAFDDRYMLQASVRRDGSSKFIKEHYGTFSSVSAAWRISSESFFNVPFISNLKPRFSIGKLGNQNIDAYRFLRTISIDNNALNYPLGGGNDSSPQEVQVGAISRSLASSDIKWEETTTTNLGIDLGLLEDQIQFTFDYFQSETKDMLVDVPVPSTSGITVIPTINGGTMENKGWEFGLSYRKAEGDFQYRVSANVSHSENKVKKLGFADEAFTFGQVIFNQHPTTRTEVGRSIGEFYLYRADGLFQNQSEIDAHGSQPSAQPGDIRFVDVTGDGEINDDDKEYVGSGLPDFEYGLTFSGSYKQIDFSIFFQGSQGNDIYNGTKFFLYRRQNNPKNFSADLLNAWTPENTNTSVPRLTAQDANQNIDRPSTFYLEDGSYLRLQNVQVGYTFGGVNNLFNSARVYLAGQNLFTITGYSGYDPANSGYQQFARGVDVGLYPTPRNLIVGVQLKF